MSCSMLMPSSRNIVFYKKVALIPHASVWVLRHNLQLLLKKHL